MKLRMVGLIVSLVLGVFFTPLEADAQQAAKVPQVGFLGPPSAPAVSHLVEVFRDGLRELGRVEGQNIVIQYRYADGKFDRLPALAAELVALNVDVIVAPTPPAVRAARNATRTIPIVMLNVADPVGLGLVASLARPGGNVTGQTNDAPELAGKLLDLAKEVVPGVATVAVLRNPANPAAALQLKEIEVAAQVHGLSLQSLGARSPDEFQAAFAVVTSQRAGALIVRADPMFFGPRKRLAELAVMSRLPAIFERREYAEAGGLIGYGPSLRDQFRRAATFVDKILKGTSPGEIPVEPPTRFELVINLKTAKALGLTIPEGLLRRADHVIQ